MTNHIEMEINLDEMSDHKLHRLMARASRLLAQRNMQRNKVVFQLLSVPEGAFIKTVKAIRLTAGFGLRETKDFVDSVPSVIPVRSENVQALEKALRDEGCEVEIIRG